MGTSELSTCEKFRLILWKNFCVSLACYKILILMIFMPLIFCLILVIMRIMIVPQFKPIKEFRRLRPDQPFHNLLAELEQRAKILMEADPDFKHNVFAPQMALGFAPDRAFTRGLVYQALYVELKLDAEKFLWFGYANCDDLRKEMYVQDFFAGVCFNLTHLDENHFDYTILFPSELRIYNDTYIGASWSTDSLYDLVRRRESRVGNRADGGAVGYIREGFTAIQNAISMSYLRAVFPGDLMEPMIQRFPYQAHYHDLLLAGTSVSLSLCILAGFLFPAVYLVYCIVQEKESQIRTIMTTMGVPNLVHFVAWFIQGLSLMFCSSILLICMLKIEWTDGHAILGKTSVLSLLIFFLAYNTVAVCFALMMSAFFSNPTYAVVVTAILWIGTYVPYIAASTLTDLETYLIVLMFLFPNSTLAVGCSLLIYFEDLYGGFTLRDIFMPSSISEDLNMAIFIAITYGLAVIYFAIGLHYEDISPDFYGLPRKWQKFIKRLMKRKTRSSARRIFAPSARHTKIFEVDPSDKKPLVKIINLFKEYKGEVVLNNVNLTLHETEITVLMGHNGAGKSMLFELMMGMEPPNSGTVLIEGFDIRTHRRLAHANLGVCLCETNLYKELTVRDQLMFFSRLRGMTKWDAEEEVVKFIKAMNIENKKRLRSKYLSPGMKRFLSVCCALAGGTKIVLLDEPSKGLEFSARKLMWELLAREKDGRTILLSTHYGLEAEVLADRVAMMSGGELTCVGSTFFLKKVYGQGHRLFIVKGEKCDADEVTDLLRQHTSNLLIKPQSDLGAELSYVLYDEDDFPEILRVLEENFQRLDMHSIMFTEMNSEHIFLHMGAEDPSEGEFHRHKQIMSGQSIYVEEYEKFHFMDGNDRVGKFRLWAGQCEAMIWKRLINTFRSPVICLLQFGLPVAFIAISFSMFSIHYEGRVALPSLEFSLRKYPRSVSMLNVPDAGEASGIYLAANEAYERLLFWIGNQHKIDEVSSAESMTDHILEVQRSSSKHLRSYFIAATICHHELIAWFSNFPLHTAPLALNMVHTALLRGYTQSAELHQVSIEPLPYHTTHKVEPDPAPAAICNYLAINIAIVLSLVWPMCIIFLVKERDSGFKLLQLISGVRGPMFWFTTFLYDILFNSCSALNIMLTILLFEYHTFLSEQISADYFSMMLIAGMAICSFNYFVASVIRDPIYAYFTATALHLLGTTCYWIFLEIFDKCDLRDTAVVAGLKWTLNVFPSFAMADGLVVIFQAAEHLHICSDKKTRLVSIVLEKCQSTPNCCRDVQIWSWEQGILPHMVFLIAFGVVFWVLLVVVESWSSWKVKLSRKKHDHSGSEYGEYAWRHSDDPMESSDLNVANEKGRVLSLDPEEYVTKRLVVANLRYSRKGVPIINDVYLIVEPSQCLGILGVNNYSKSTLMRLLVADTALDTGRIYVDGISLIKNPTKVYARIGYCCQDDPYLPEYEGYDVLRSICLMRGLPSNEVTRVIENLSKILGFYNHLYKKIEFYSSGTKRRLTIACALVGDPSLLLIDETSTNLDLAGIRQLWNIISRLCKNGRSVIVASNNTIEWECICNRFAILSDGRISRIGQPYAINHEYSKGYLLQMKIKTIKIYTATPTDDWLKSEHRVIEPDPYLKLTTFIDSAFPHSLLMEHIGRIIIYFIPLDTTSMSEIFTFIRRHAFNLYIEDYSITRATLSSIFMDFEEEYRRTREEAYI